MRKIYVSLFAVIITVGVFAQAPLKMSYQAIIRNSSNQLVTSHAVGIKISILEGSPTGTVVYSETITPTPSTNANGLVSIEIGGGIGFNSINWSNSSFFIKTETDPTGGTTYTITNTSQLLTVPYAFHAKTAESLTSVISETDPIFVAWNKSTGINITSSQVSDFQTSVTNNAAVLANTAKSSYPSADALKLAGIASGAEVNVNADWNATSGDAQILNKPNITTADGSETKVNAGTNITITGTGTTGNPYVINSTSGGSGFTHFVGELYGGGIVVSVWKVSGVEHGLIASLADISTGIAWSNITSSLIGTTAQSPSDGQANTNAIIAQLGHTASAAKLCDDYTNPSTGTGVYSDWYLPSIWELMKCYNAALEVNIILGASNGFQSATYWSSSEEYDIDALNLAFNEGSGDEPLKSNLYRVRAVRRF